MVASPNKGSVQWSSRLAFLLAAIGSSVGLGNLWRFSAEAGTHGGGAFILLYLLCIVLVGIPTVMSEILIGRAGQANSAIGSVQDLASRSRVSQGWSLSAWLGMIAAFLIVSFYCVVAAWVASYIPRFLTGAFQGQSPDEIAAQFDVMISTPHSVVPWFLGFALLTTCLVARGVNRGIEASCRILMPVFFGLLFVLSVYSVATGWSSGGTQKALEFLFWPDFSKISASVALGALGQAFFSLGVGLAVLITYGSYLPHNASIPKSSLIICGADTAVALVAGLAIFPVVFTFGLDFSAGAGLFFQTLPTAMAALPGGGLVGATFFFLALVAAITSSIGLLEPVVAYVSESFSVSRPVSAVSLGLLMTGCGLFSIYVPGFMDFLDSGLTGPILMPVSGLLVVVFVGWRLKAAILAGELAPEDEKLGGIILFLVRYVTPLLVAAVLLFGLHDKYFKL